MLHALLLCLVVFSPEAAAAGGLPPRVSGFEVAFWAWTSLFFVAELKEFKNFAYEGIHLYIGSNWNKVDMANILLITASMVLRIVCIDEKVARP